MKKVLPITILLIILSNIFIQSVFAQKTKLVGELKTEIAASVGQYYLNLSGFISPYASIVLTTQDGIFMRAAVADGKGRFSISQVLIKRGFSAFCLTAVDFKRIGESVTCFSFPPVEASITMDNLFLPPTLGLRRAEIAAGEKAVAFGYTMPGAIVILKLSNGKTLTTIADSGGYYEFGIDGLTAGEYELFATAHHEGQESLKPTKLLVLKALSLWERFAKFWRDLFQRLLALLTGIITNPIWIAIPLIILIIIFILKLWPGRFTFIYDNNPVNAFIRKFQERPLHHWWWVGY